MLRCHCARPVGHLAVRVLASTAAHTLASLAFFCCSKTGAALRRQLFRFAGFAFNMGGRAVFIQSALGTLVIEDSMGVHAVGMRGVVLEDDTDRVADFGVAKWDRECRRVPIRERAP